jgi:MFS family permease
VEYLAASKYGLELSTSEIAMLVAVIPNLARMLINPLWGRLFDRLSFPRIRLLANLGFIIGIFAFFFSTSLWGLCLGSIFYGIGNAGGEITWNLWITRCAPIGRAAAYMSVHTCLTGIRGVLAPLLAFHLTTIMSITSIGWISAGLMIFSNVFLFLPSSRPREPEAGESSALAPAPEL